MLLARVPEQNVARRRAAAWRDAADSRLPRAYVRGLAGLEVGGEGLTWDQASARGNGPIRSPRPIGGHGIHGPLPAWQRHAPQPFVVLPSPGTVTSSAAISIMISSTVPSAITRDLRLAGRETRDWRG